MRQVHSLKTWPDYFQDVKKGFKTFELRKDDRDFKVGDTLVLLEYNPQENKYTGDMVIKQVSYKLSGCQFGLIADYCILGFADRKIEETEYLERINAVMWETWGIKDKTFGREEGKMIMEILNEWAEND